MIEKDDLPVIVSEVEKVIENHFFSRADDRYMTKDSCDKRQNDIYEKISKMSEDFNEMKVKSAQSHTLLKIVVGILGAIGTALIPICLKLLFGG